MLDLADYRDLDRAAPRQLVLSPDGLAHLKLHEGFRARTYDDFRPDYPFRPGEIAEGTLTIGYGHTGEEAFPGNRIDTVEAEAMLLEEVEGFEAELRDLVRVPLAQGEYDALVSFLYNVGAANFRRSTLLRKLNAGDYDGAAMEFSRWVYSKGRRLKGLKLRRMAEAAMFEGAFKYGLLDVAAMAREAEELLGIGSSVRPDAVEERGAAKPLTRSRTILGAVLGAVPLGGLGAALTTFETLDWRVQMAALGLAGMAFLFLVVNRLREHRAGEH